MEKIKKWRTWLIALLTLLFAATLSLALVQIIPSKAEDTYDTDDTDGDLVCDGNTADYTIKADSGFSYDNDTNKWFTPGGIAPNNQFTLTVSGAGNICFQYKGSGAGGHNLSIYKTSTDTDPIFSRNYGSTVQSETTTQYILEADYAARTPFTVTLLNVEEGDVYIFKADVAFQAYELTGFKKATTNYNVSATIAGDVHGTVSIGDNTLNTDTVTGSTQVEMGKTITLTASPEAGYFAFWQDAAGKVVCRENAFTTPAVQGDTDYTVRFEKIGANGLKIYYPSKVGKDSQTSSGWIKDVADEVTTYKVGIPALAKAKFTTTLEFTFEGAGVLDFDYHFYYHEVKGSKSDASLKVDGEVYARMPKLDYTYTDLTTSRDETNADQWQHATLYISGEGSHTVTLEYSLDYDNRAVATNFVAFSVKKTELSSPVAHTFTLDYDEKLGEISVLGATKNEGNTYTGYDGFPITLTANTTNVISSLDKETDVATQFVNWVLDSETPAGSTLNIMFEDGQLTYDGHVLSDAKVKGVFEEETVRPIVFRQISNTEVETARTTNGEEVKISIENAAESQLRLFTAGFGEDNETVSLKVNGVETSLQTIPRDEGFGDMLTAEMLEAFSQNEQEINWWLQTALGEQLVLEVSYSCEGYFGTSTLKAYITYTAEIKQLGSFNNALNNLFTEDSEEGASVDCKTEQGEGETAWSATDKWESEGGSIIFENNQKQANLGDWSPGITSGEGSNLWYYTFLRIQIGQDSGQLRKGVLMFDLYFEMTEGNGDRNGAVVVERRDNGYSNAPDEYQGSDVDYMPEHALGGKEGLFNSACITSVLEHTNDTHIWGMSSNTYVTDLGGGWYRCVFPTVRECEYPGENDSTTHDTRQFLITFGYMSGTSPRYAIRNVTFRNGQDANFQFEANNTAYNSDVTATAGGEQVTIGTPKQVGFGSTVELKATAPQGKKFYGWEVKGSNGNSTYYASTEVKSGVYTLKYTVLDPVTIVAWFGEESEFTARIGGHFYPTLSESITEAKKLGTAEIVVVRDGITLNESLEIPKGISLILPFSEEGGYFGSAASGKYATDSRIAWADSGLQQKNRFLTFTIESGVTLTVKGRLYVGGVMNHTSHNYQGHTSGKYAEIINKGNIIIEDGGVMDVYGRVTGAGSIEVKSGAELKEPFLILDFEGGTETLGLFMDGLTPFKRYAMINIECEFTVRYGARLVGHATLYALNQYVSLDQAFIDATDDYGRDTMIMLKPNAYVTVNYNAGKVVQGATPTNGTEGIGETTMNFHGGATFSYMQFTAMGITVPTSGVYFSIPYNFNLQLDGNGIYETKTDFMVMPGAVVHVCAGSKLILHANTWIFDGLKQGTLIDKSYPSAEDLSAVGYSKNGNLIVDGTLEIQQKYGLDNHTALPVESNLDPAVFVGIVQTTGTSGKIIIANDAILKWTVVDGRENKNYFAYTTTARVWDAVHKKFGDLEAGKTYTATSGAEFHPENLKYANAEDGQETQTLDLSGVVMHGSWKLVHDKDSFDWSKLLDGEGQFKGNKNYEVLERVCTELGCDHADHRLLLKSDSIKISAIYKGENFSKDELAQLLIKYFFGDGDALPEEVAEFFTLTKEDGKTAIVFTVTLAGDEGNNANANTYSDLTLSAEGCFFGSSMAETAKFAFTVEKFDLEKGDAAKIQEIKDAIAAKLTGFTYDGTEHKREVNTLGDGVFNGTLLNIEKAEWAHNVDAGTASVTLTGTGNFTGTLTVTFSIAKAELTVTIVAAGSTYGEKIKTPGFTLSGDVAKDTAEIRKAITVKVDAAQWSDVGTYAVTATEDKAADVLKNYEVKFANSGKDLYTVSAKNIEGAAKATAASKTYNGAEQDAELKITFDGYLERFTEGQYEVTYDKEAKNAGTYTVTIKGQNNFSGEITCAFEITKAEVTVKVLQQTYTYNRSEQAFKDSEDAWEATLLGEDAKSVLGVTLVGAATDAGTYAVVANFKSDNYNVTFEGEDKALVIEKAKIDSAAVEQGTYTYSGQAITPKLTVNAGELTLEAGEYSVSYDDNINARKVTVTVTTDHKNFQGSATANFEILQKDISEATVAVQGTYTYNGEAQSVEEENVTVTLDGITGDVTFNIKADGYTANTDAGEATLTIEGTGNFTGTAKGNFQIAQKAIKIRPKNVSATYGDNDKELSFELYESELAAKDDENVLEVKLERAAGRNVNDYEIRITSATAANYEIDFSATGTYSIAKKKITVTVKDQTYTYNGSAQSVQSRYKTDWELATDALEYDDAETVLGVVLSGTGKDVKADGYPITGSYKANNYEVEFTKEGKLRIEKAEVTVKANDGQTPEGETQAELSFTVSGYFEDVGAFKKTIKIYVDGDVEASKAGTELKIVVTFEEGTTAANYPNYNVKFIQGTYTIMEAVFKGVTFTGETVIYDGTAHTITVKGLDLANAHKGANVVYTQDGKPFASAVDAGTYAITATVSLGEYNPLVLNATLKIEKREVEITLKDATSVYGAALAELTFTHAKGVDKDREIIEKAVHLTTTATSLSDVAGSYTINASFDETTNYTFKVMNTAKYTLTPKAIEVTILQQNWAIYTGKEQNARSSVNEWTVEAGALVGNDSTTGLKVTLTGGGTNVGSYPIEGTSANGNYTVTFKGGEKAFVIAPKDLSEAVIGGLDLTFTYNEKQQRPVVTVTLSGFDAALKLQEEYTVEYGHNITVAEGGSVTVKGTGNFCGEASKTFRIVPKEISGASIEVTEENILFKNAQWQPSFTAALEGYDSFVRDTDYTVEYGANLHAGETEGTITLKGQGNFGGTATMHFAILAAPLADVTVEEEGFIYTGKPIQPRITVTANGLTLTKNDYSVSYGERGNVNAGQAEVIVTATNPDYTGTAKATFEIAPKDLQGARVAVTGSYTYNGSAITPRKEEITVTLSGYEGITFSFAATENVDATRTALVTVTGTENFCGTASAYFTIGAKEIAATLNAQSFVYSGKVPVPDSTKYTLAEDALCSQNGKTDVLGVVITTNAKKDVGTYSLSATAANKNYKVNFDTAAQLTITKKAITVKADDITAYYGEKIKPYTFTAEGLAEGEKQEELVALGELKVTLYVDSTISDAKTYPIRGEGSAKNYSFEVEGGTYTVLPKEITVTIESHEKVYDGTAPTVNSSDWRVPAGSVVGTDNLGIVLEVVDAAADVKEGGYTIRGTASNQNYHVTFIEGTFTISPRPITVQIEDQSETFDYDKAHHTEGSEYAFDPAAWRILEDGNTFAGGETSEVLGLTLSVDPLVHAGVYAIRGNWSNKNYLVRFTGSYKSDDALSGTAGTYTIEKLDVSDFVVFMLEAGEAGDEGVMENDRTVRVRFEGTPIKLACSATLFMGAEPIDLATTLDHSSLGEVGDFEVLVTIEDTDYCGSATFLVVVTDADGYTQHLRDVLEDLAALAQKLGPELDAEDYATLVEMSEALASLNDAEKEVGAEQLKPYQNYVDEWNDLAAIDDVIDTAKTIANAPIGAIFAAAAAISALAALAYIVCKGGIL